MSEAKASFVVLLLFQSKIRRICFISKNDEDVIDIIRTYVLNTPLFEILRNIYRSCARYLLYLNPDGFVLSLK